MATIRQGNWLGQARVDVRDFRGLESAIAADFDILGGQVFAGERPLVLDGVTVPTSGIVGAAATSLQVDMTGALLLHFGATSSGTLFTAPADRGLEVLNSGNARVFGSWASGAMNYLGLSLVRSADSATADVVKFLVPATDSEIGQTIPLARTVDYQFIISTIPFSAQPTVLPIAKVGVDSSGNVTGVTDAREMSFRLGRGGDLPSQEGFTWPEGRAENYGGSGFAGGDKAISSLKDWMDAAMTRIWEIGGGENWYSATADRNVTLIWTGTTFSNGENFEWSGTNLHWKGLRFLFDNSTGTYNDILDQTTDSAGLTDLADGECLYVDLDRSANRTGGTALVAEKSTLTTLGTGNRPGARTLLAWRVGANVYTRNWRYPVGQTFTAATTSSLGVVQLNQTPGSLTNPVVVSVMSNGEISVLGGTSTIGAGNFTNSGTGPGLVGNGGTGNSYSLLQAGLVGYGANGAAGTATRQFGRHGIYGLGGTGSVGGGGGIFQGGNGDVLLNANAIGGGGLAATGGDGVGAGAGGAGASATGGLAGDGVTRAPAFKSNGGPVEVPSTDIYKFATAKTGSLIIPAADFQVHQETTKTPLLSIPISVGATVTPAWLARNADTGTFVTTIRLPRGATINAVYLNVHNQDGVDRNLLVYAEQTVFKGTGTPTANTTIYNGASVTCTNGTDGWFSCGAPPAVSATDGGTLGTDAISYIWLSVHCPTLTFDQALKFKGVVIQYTYQTVDFMV